MIEFLKTYVIYILLGIIITLTVAITYLFLAKQIAENEIKMRKNDILELKKEIFLLKENAETDVANAEIKTSSENTLQELKKLKELDQDEELETHDHTNNNGRIFDGMYLISPKK